MPDAVATGAEAHRPAPRIPSTPDVAAVDRAPTDPPSSPPAPVRDLEHPLAVPELDVSRRSTAGSARPRAQPQSSPQASPQAVPPRLEPDRVAAGRSRFDVRPLDRITSIKTKFAFVIIIAVGVSAAVSQIGFALGTEVWLRPPIAMVISLVIVQFLAHGMTSPLRDMERAASHIAQGDYSQRVPVTSRDEVGRLSLAFNAMAAELSEVDRMRRDLVANVSHELRTPISALQAHLENIVDGVEPADPEVLRTMLAQTERLGRMVTQLLDLSRLESGGSPLHSRPFDVAPLLEQAADESRLHRPDIEVRVVVDPPTLAMTGDPERIHQVVANLLENAARYSPSDQCVEVSGRRDGTEVVIDVTDHGPGIPAGEEVRIFERFYRADHARATERGGAGLGLAISRWIVDLHGGHIHAERREPGCRMVVRLPL